MIKKIIATFFALALILVILINNNGNIKTFAVSPILSLNLNTESTGSKPFNTGECLSGSNIIVNKGEDVCTSDKIVRTNDIVVYRYDYSVNLVSSNESEIIHTLPIGLKWLELPPLCTAESTITDQDRTLNCKLGYIELGFAGTIKSIAKVNGDVANGQEITSSAVFIDNSSLSKTESNSTDIIVTSSPRWDLAMNTIYSEPIKKVGKNKNETEFGVIQTYPIIIRALNGVKGIEKLKDQISFKNDLSAISPNSELYTWGDFNGCKNIGFDQFSPSLPFSKSTIFNDIERGSKDSGNISCEQVNNVVNVTIENMDTDLSSYPTQNINGVNLPADEFIAVSFSISVFTPFSDFIDSTLSFTNSFTDFKAISLSGEPIFNTGNETNLDNNTISLTLSQAQDGSFDKKIIPETINATSYKSRDGYISPNTKFTSILEGSNNTTVNFTNVIMCDKIDNSVSKFTGNTNLALTQGGNLPDGYIVQYGQSSVDSLESLRDKKCDDSSADTANWSIFPIDQSNMVRIIISQLPVGVYVQYRIEIETREFFSNGSNINLPIPDGTRIWDFGAVIFPESGFGWYIGGNNCNMVDLFSVCDYTTLTRSIVRIKKKSFRQNGVTPTNIAIGNQIINYKLEWTHNSKSVGNSDIEIEDTLPPSLVYQTNVNANIKPDTIIENIDGSTTLKWIFSQSIANENKPIIEYFATTIPDLQPSEYIINKAVIKSNTDISDEKTRTAYNTIVSQVVEGFNITNVSNPSRIGQNGYYNFNLNYENRTLANLNNIDIIGVLPNLSNSKNNFHGTTNLVGVESYNSEDLLYTKSLNVINDPYDITNQPEGATIWCPVQSFGNLECPEKIEDTTAIRIISDVYNANTKSRTVKLFFKTENNQNQDRYSMNFGARTSDINLVIYSNNQYVVVDKKLYNEQLSSLTSSISISSNQSESSSASLSSDNSSSINSESAQSSLISSSQNSSINSSESSTPQASSSNSSINSTNSTSSILNSSSQSSIISVFSSSINSSSEQSKQSSLANSSTISSSSSSSSSIKSNSTSISSSSLRSSISSSQSSKISSSQSSIVISLATSSGIRSSNSSPSSSESKSSSKNECENEDKYYQNNGKGNDENDKNDELKTNNGNNKCNEVCINEDKYYQNNGKGNDENDKNGELKTNNGNNCSKESDGKNEKEENESKSSQSNESKKVENKDEKSNDDKKEANISNNPAIISTIAGVSSIAAISGISYASTNTVYGKEILKKISRRAKRLFRKR